MGIADVQSAFNEMAEVKCTAARMRYTPDASILEFDLSDGRTISFPARHSVDVIKAARDAARLASSKP